MFCTTPERWSTDHGKGTTAGLKSGQTTARRQHPIILTVSKCVEPVVDGGQVDGGQVAHGELVVSGGGGAVAFELVDAALHGVPL